MRLELGMELVFASLCLISIFWVIIFFSFDIDTFYLHHHYVQITPRVHSYHLWQGNCLLDQTQQQWSNQLENDMNVMSFSFHSLVSLVTIIIIIIWLLIFRSFPTWKSREKHNQHLITWMNGSTTKNKSKSSQIVTICNVVWIAPIAKALDAFPIVFLVSHYR